MLTASGPFGEYILGERTVLITAPWRIALTGLGILGATLLLARLRTDRAGRMGPAAPRVVRPLPGAVLTDIGLILRPLSARIPAGNSADPAPRCGTDRRDWVPGLSGLGLFAGAVCWHSLTTGSPGTLRGGLSAGG